MSLCVILYYRLSVVTDVSVCYIVLSAKCRHCLSSLCVILYYRLSVFTDVSVCYTVLSAKCRH